MVRGGQNIILSFNLALWQKFSAKTRDLLQHLKDLFDDNDNFIKDLDDMCLSAKLF